MVHRLLAAQYRRFRAAPAGKRVASARWMLLALVAIVMVVLAACEDEEHRAVQPGASRSIATAIIEGSETSVASPDAGYALDADFQMTALPETERVYFAVEGDLWRIGADEDPEPVVEDEQLVDFSPSARGDRLALLRTERADGRDAQAISIVGPEGSSIRELDDAAVNNTEGVFTDVQSLALDPAGNILAMTRGDGGITVIDRDDDAAVLIDPALGRAPGAMAWSPDGSLIAYLDPWFANTASALYVIVAESGQRQVLVPPENEEHGVVRAAWIPGTSLLAYVASSSASIDRGGDLFLVDATSGERRLLVSSGQFAPVAGVVDLAVSPSGDRLAFTVFTPGDMFPESGGLHVIDFQSGELQEVDVESGWRVTDLWWLGDRLLYRAIEEPRTSAPGVYTGLEVFRLLEVDPISGTTETRFEYDPTEDDSS